MKNLNKKIGAIALAAMVVAGGFVASGAQSFALYGGLASALVDEENIVPEGDMKELQDMIDSSRYSGDYKVIISYQDEFNLKYDAQELYPDFSQSLQKSMSLGNNSRVAKRRLSYYLSRHNIFMVRYKGQHYLIKLNSLKPSLID